jgi:hypothetical protein
MMMMMITRMSHSKMVSWVLCWWCVWGGCRDLSIQIILVEPYRYNLTNIDIPSLGLLYINKAKKTKQEIKN